MEYDRRETAKESEEHQNMSKTQQSSENEKDSREEETMYGEATAASASQNVLLRRRQNFLKLRDFKQDMR